jgi:hypothetical protein
MCNERQERLIERFCATVCSGDDIDPVEVTLYPEWPILNRDDITYGVYPRAELVREGVEVVQYGTFCAETWDVAGLTDLRVRPWFEHPLTPEMIAEIEAEIDAILPDDDPSVDY